MIEDGSALTPGRRRFLRYWALNMTLARQYGWVWTPGFTYSRDEWGRMNALTAAIPGTAVIAWLTATALIFIGLAAGLTAAIMGFALTVLWPDPSKMPEVAFFALLIMVLVLAIGLGMPLSIVWGGGVADWFASGTPQAEAPEDAALFGKVARQFVRMAIGLGALVALSAVGWSLVGWPL